MPIQSANGGRATSLGATAKDVADHAKTLVKLEIELATLEIKRKAATLGIGIGLLVGAAIFALFGIGFALATIAAALATTVAVWLALLIVTLGVLVLTGLLALVGVKAVKKATPPLPDQAIEEAKLTTEALKGHAEAH
jgi:hypothetical protein